MGLRGFVRAQAASAKLLSALMLSVILLLAVVTATGCASNKAYKNPVIPAPPERPLPPVPDGGYTWQQLANHVIAANQDYNAILADARAVYYRYKSRTDLRDLQFSLETSLLSEDRRRESYDAGIRFSIPNPFVNRQIIRTGDAARRETETGAEALKGRIVSAIHELVQEITIGERELSVLNLREQALSDWAAYLKLRYDANMATQADIRELDLQRLRLKAAVQRVQLSVIAARRSLQVLVQIPEEQLVLNPFPSDWKSLLETLEDEEKLIEDIYSRSAELAGAYAAYQKAIATLGTARAKQIPWFSSVHLSYSSGALESASYNYLGELIPARRKSKWTVGLNVDLPAFAWFSAEKKMAAAEVEAASLRASGISRQIRDDMAGIITNLRDTLHFLLDYRTTYDAIPEPTRETIPNSESYYKLMDAKLSAAEYTLRIEMQCAQIYSQLLEAAGVWE